MPATVPGTALILVFSFLSALHIYWALGGQWGYIGVIPQVGGKATFKPTTTATVVVAAALATAAALIAARIGLFPSPLPAPVLRAAVYVLAAVFTLRAIGDFRVVGLFKRVRGTRFASLDDRFFIPLCTLIAATAFWLA